MHNYYIFGLVIAIITGFIVYRYGIETPRDRLVKLFSEKTKLAKEAKMRGDEKEYRDQRWEAEFFCEMIKRYDMSDRKDKWR